MLYHTFCCFSILSLSSFLSRKLGGYLNLAVFWCKFCFEKFHLQKKSITVKHFNLTYKPWNLNKNVWFFKSFLAKARPWNEMHITSTVPYRVVVCTAMIVAKTNSLCNDGCRHTSSIGFETFWVAVYNVVYYCRTHDFTAARFDYFIILDCCSLPNVT